MICALTGQGFMVSHACRALGVSESGYYAWRVRPASARKLRWIWLAGEITDVHRESGGTYGAHRIRAELRYGRSIQAGHNQIARIMRDIGLHGTPHRRLPKGVKVGKATSLDLVRRAFRRDRPNQLWMTDITEHTTREGKLYCAVVLDAFSRMIVGWAIDTTQTTRLVTDALSMAVHRPARTTALCCTQTAAFNSRLGRSARRSAAPASHPQWERSAAHTITPWSRRSGAGCKSSCSTAGAGKPASSSPPRSATTSTGSTTPAADTAPSACSHPPNTNTTTQ